MKKPSIEEIQDYCDERQNDIDAEAFWCFYESKGWVVGKAPMKSWKACVITWEKRQPKPKPKDDFITRITDTSWANQGD